MAYDGSGAANFTGRSNYDLYLYVRRDQTDEFNNRSNYAWELQARHRSGSNQSFRLDSRPWYVTIAGQNFSGSGNLDFRGRGTIVFAQGTTAGITHNSGGYLSFDASASYPDGGIFGRADLQFTFNADRIPQPPTSPNVYAAFPAANGTQCEVRYTSEGMSDGGSPITGWTMQVATNSAFSQNLRTFTSANNGIQLITNLTPGTQYFVRVAAKNAVTERRGALGGAWSNTGSFTTPIQGIGRIWNGSAWVAADGRIWNGSAWVAADARIWNGSAWVNVGS